MSKKLKIGKLLKAWWMIFGNFFFPYYDTMLLDDGDDIFDEYLFCLAPCQFGLILRNNLLEMFEISPIGKLFLDKPYRKEEILIRQMLKFQIPTPYNKDCKTASSFWIKPYLEVLRSIRQLGFLNIKELQFLLQRLNKYDAYELAIKEIEENRFKKNDKLPFYASDSEMLDYRDYADACFRYLRATGLVSVSHVGKSLSIVPERIEDVDYILKTVSRDPVFVDDEKTYLAYLGDATTPMLLTDDRSRLEKRILNEFPEFSLPHSLSLDDLKNLFSELLEQRKQQSIDKQTIEIKRYRHYNDIQNVFEQIKGNKLYDAPLMLEWNTWRAMTMMDGGTVDANLNFDDYGNPLSTAAGNQSDIICDYGDFMLSVEVTMASGQRQYETEGEPVSRHLGKLKKTSGKPCYCLFVAPTIHEACISHFYTLQHLNVSLYGGTSTIVPLPLNVFQKMLEDSYKASFVPNPTHLQQFFETSIVVAGNSKNEKEWYETMVKKATHWLE